MSERNGGRRAANDQRGADRGQQQADGLRVPPQSIDAEQAVLGGLMLVPAALAEVADLLRGEDFYRRDHARIYGAIVELEEKGRPFDAVTLGEWFESRGESELVAGGAYLIELASTTPSAANIRAYAEIVRDKATLRAMIERATEIANDGFCPDGRDVEQLVGTAATRMTDLANRENRAGGLMFARSLLPAVYEQIQQAYAGKADLGMPPPWQPLRSIVPGFADTDLALFAARPGMGKTVAGLEAAIASARTRGATAFFSLEMSRSQLLMRAVSSLSGVPASRMRQEGGVQEDEWPRIAEAMRELRQLPLAIDDEPSLTITQLRARAKRMHAKVEGGLRCIVLDYVQLLEGTGKGEKRHDQISEISRGLKLLAKEIGCPVIALSQLNRSLESRPNRRPLLSDLRESGALEQDADVIVFLYRDDYYNEQTAGPGVAEMIVAKQRSGPTGTVYVKHDLPCSRFLDYRGPKPNYDAQSVGSGREQRAGFGRRRLGNQHADAACGEPA